ncbi:alpha/beta fold hydrolase [Streptomyces sp. NPDC056821]|uniref:alpha/beta fold hydrolase n=1 Tax=unclassified Streptomyces TaxID=2593676 RepID=UPI0036C53CC3
MRHHPVHGRGGPCSQGGHHDHDQTHHRAGARAFADASSWNGVVERLQRRGYTVIAPANPLRGLHNDSTYIASVLDSIKGPIVLVGHSYGGAVISSAAEGNPRAKSLVYVSALMSDVGESGMSLSTRFPSELDTVTKAVP